MQVCEKLHGFCLSVCTVGSLRVQLEGKYPLLLPMISLDWDNKRLSRALDESVSASLRRDPKFLSARWKLPTRQMGHTHQTAVGP